MSRSEIRKQWSISINYRALFKQGKSLFYIIILIISTEPQLFWIPAKFNEKTHDLLKKSKANFESKIEEFKKASEEKL
jgi:hypothetical protein